MDQQLAALVGRHLAAENGQDLAGTLATLHPECVFEDFATGQVWHGHEGAAAHYRQWWTAFDVTVKRGPGQSGGWLEGGGYMAEVTCTAAISAASSASNPRAAPSPSRSS